MWSEGDTIAAIATPKGTGALGIVRVSGPQTHQVISACFDSKTFDSQESHRAFYGIWKEPETGRALDEVVLLNFSPGKGFTGEAACEIICHGGCQVTNLILDAAVQAGARLARPGEFTFRAYMNGKLDLSQAEAIHDLIASRSPKAAELALLNIQGGLSSWLLKLEECLTRILANLEASIDFTTEDIQPFDYPELATQVKAALEDVSKILDSHVSSQLATQGLRVVLVGKPNVGKSSLLNSLVGRQKSIVTDLPGTTRDAIEVDILVNQNLVTLIDTAGLREAQDLVESLGIEKTNSELKTADLVVYVIDASCGIQNDDVEFCQKIDPSRLLVCINKSDLKSLSAAEVQRRFGLTNINIVNTSALESDGVGGLRKEFSKIFDNQISPDLDAVVGSDRQKEELVKCRGRLQRALDLLEERASQELISFEMNDALRSVQDTIGKVPDDDVLNRVFREFCIGK